MELHYLFIRLVILIFLYDTNGDRGPNSVGIDCFDFLLKRGTGKFETFSYIDNLDEDSEDYSTDLQDRDNILYLCKNVDAKFCSRLLFLDNWEFKDDYPYRL